MVNGNDRRPHFLLEEHGTPEKFTSPKSGRSTDNVPRRNRAQQAARLRAQLKLIEGEGEREPGMGLQIEFRGFAGIELTTESLANDRSGIELLNVRRQGNVLLATVFVPQGKLGHFERYITAYLERRENKNGDPIDHRKLIDAIRDIRLATVRALWTDDAESLPGDSNQQISWEVWLPVRKDRRGILGEFRVLAQRVGWEYRHARSNSLNIPFLSAWVRKLNSNTRFPCSP